MAGSHRTALFLFPTRSACADRSAAVLSARRRASVEGEHRSLCRCALSAQHGERTLTRLRSTMHAECRPRGRPAHASRSRGWLCSCLRHRCPGCPACHGCCCCSTPLLSTCVPSRVLLDGAPDIRCRRAPEGTSPLARRPSPPVLPTAHSQLPCRRWASTGGALACSLALPPVANWLGSTTVLLLSIGRPPHRPRSSLSTIDSASAVLALFLLAMLCLLPAGAAWAQVRPLASTAAPPLSASPPHRCLCIRACLP